MTQEVKVIIWCDPCQAEDARTEGDHYEPVQLPGAKPLAVDLCERHYKEFLAPLEEMLSAHGQKAGAPSPAPSSGQRRYRPREGSDPIGPPYLCKVPDCPSEHDYANAASLGSHVRTVHGLTLADYRGALTSGDWPESAVRSWACTEPGCDKDYSENALPAQALGLHRAKAHGIHSERNDNVARRTA